MIQAGLGCIGGVVSARLTEASMGKDTNIGH